MDCPSVVAVPSLYRRRLLGLVALAPWISACGIGHSALSRKLRGLQMEPISSEELELLRDISTRKAWQAKQGLPETAPLEIRNRIFWGKRQLLRGADITNVRFVNCRFEAFQGYDNNLDHVVFEECLFLGGVFIGDDWLAVSFLSCEGEGPFKIGCADGDIVFDNCRLRGMKAKEGGYGNWSDHFGVATASEGVVRFSNCLLENVGVGGNKGVYLTGCKIFDLSGGVEGNSGVLVMDSCKSVGKVDFGGGSGFVEISINNSSIEFIDLMSVSARKFDIIDSDVGLKIGGRRASFGNIFFKNVDFSKGGLYMPLIPSIISLVFDGCKVDPSATGLQIFGEPNMQPRPGEGPVSWCGVEHLTFRNQQLSKPNMSYLQVGTLTLDNSILEGADLTHSRYGTIEFIDSKLTGTLDLTDTTIQHIDNRGLVNNAKVLGKLEADPQVPAPDLEPPSAAQSGSAKAKGPKAK